MEQRSSSPDKQHDLLRRLALDLGRLRRDAGDPSTRAIAQASSISHDTVHRVLRCGSTGKIPRWNSLEQIVLALGGDPGPVRALWNDCRGAQLDAELPRARETQPSASGVVDATREQQADPGDAVYPWFESAAALGTRRRFRAGDLMFLQGDTSSHVLILVSGTAKSSVVGMDGRETIVEYFAPGQLIGLEASLDGFPQPMGVRALTPITAIQLTGDHLLQVMARRPAVGAEVARQLAARNRMLVDRASRNHLPATQRICTALLELVQRTPASEDNADNPAARTISVSQYDLASFVGIAGPTCERALVMLRERGIIATRYRRITILNMDVLRALAYPDEPFQREHAI